ncbi:MAG TPA: MarC family protein [Candidatus Binatia bacterium]|nr:MarC family protein [Candidatus Binatia bacterium]
MSPAVADSITFTLSTMTTLFFVVDPPATAPIFLSMTARDSQEHKRRTAFRAAVATFVTLAMFAAIGGLVFRLLGISLGAFRIAGGLLLFLLAVDMLRAERSRQRTSPEEEAEGADKVDISVFPLAIPMLAGPGAISTVMVLVSRAEHLWHYGVIVLAIATTALGVLFTLRGALVIERRLGQTGLNVLQRVMGLILAAVAVQFVIEGLEYVAPLLTAASRG